LKGRTDKTGKVGRRRKNQEGSLFEMENLKTFIERTLKSPKMKTFLLKIFMTKWCSLRC